MSSSLHCTFLATHLVLNAPASPSRPLWCLVQGLAHVMLPGLGPSSPLVAALRLMPKAVLGQFWPLVRLNFHAVLHSASTYIHHDWLLVRGGGKCLRCNRGGCAGLPQMGMPIGQISSHLYTPHIQLTENFYVKPHCKPRCECQLCPCTRYLCSWVFDS
jgi:hypothetical protein